MTGVEHVTAVGFVEGSGGSGAICLWLSGTGCGDEARCLHLFTAKTNNIYMREVMNSAALIRTTCIT